MCPASVCTMSRVCVCACARAYEWRIHKSCHRRQCKYKIVLLFFFFLYTYVGPKWIEAHKQTSPLTAQLRTRRMQVPKMQQRKRIFMHLFNSVRNCSCSCVCVCGNDSSAEPAHNCVRVCVCVSAASRHNVQNLQLNCDAHGETER